MLRNPRPIGWLLVISLSVVLCGCSREAKKNRHLQRAQEQLKTGDYDRAEIGFLNALQLDPTNAVAIRNLGVMCYEQGRIPRAVVLLQKAKAMDTNDAYVRLHLGLALFGGGGANEARQEALFVLDRQPTNQQAMVLLVNSSVTTNTFWNTVQRLQDLQRTGGNTINYHLGMGLIQVRTNDAKAAEESFKRAIALDSQSSLAHQGLAGAYLLANNRQMAEAEFKTSAELAPPRSPQRMRYAEFKAAMGDVAAAREMLQAMQKETPDFLPAPLRLAQMAFAENDYKECGRLVTAVLGRDQYNLDAIILSGNLNLALNEPVKAVADFKWALELFPGSPQLHYLLAMASLRNNQLTDALNNLNQAVTRQPDYVDANLLLSELNIRRGEAGAAIPRLTTLISKRPDLARAHLLLADAYRIEGDLDAALKVYQNLSQTYSTNAELPLLTGLVQRQQGKNADARKSFEQSLQLSPGYWPAISQLTGLDITEKSFDAAYARLQKEMDKNPSLSQPYHLKAQVDMAQTNFGPAETALLKALDLNPDFEEARLFLAQVYVAAKKEKEALDRFQEVVARNSNDLTARFQIAQIQSASGDKAAAIQTYEKMLTINSNSVPVLNNLSWLYTEDQKDLNRGVELARRARTLAPASPQTADTLGWALYHRGEYSQALPLIQEATDKLPQEPEVLFHLGMTQYMLGQEEAARTRLRAAVQMSRETPWRAEANEHLEILSINAANADASATAQLEKKLSTRPGDPVVLSRLAAIYERNNAIPKAITATEQLLKATPDRVPARIKLAQMYLSVSNNASALEMARKARDLAPFDADIAHTLGRVAYSAGDHAWASLLLNDAVQKKPNDEVLFDYALAAYSIGRVSDAQTAMQRALSGQQAMTRTEQGKTFLRMNALATNSAAAQAAAAEVQNVLGKEPGNVPALMARAAILEAKGDYAPARDEYEKILKLMPRFTPATRQLALLYHDNLNDSQKAQALSLKALEAFPNDAQIKRVLGALAYERKDYGRAVQLLADSAREIKTNATLLYHLGISQYQTGNGRQGKETLTVALNMAPTSPLAAEAKRLTGEK
jgi:tetratricopeptide (TPR) repeat protein